MKSKQKDDMFAVEYSGEPFYLCSAGEKGRCVFTVTIEGTGGPSCFPSENRAVDKLLELLERMADFRFEEDENPAARRFDELLGPQIEDPFLRALGEYNRHDAIILRSYDAGSQVNVLPSRIGFEAELRLLPPRRREDAENLLGEIFRDIDAHWEITSFQPGFILRPERRDLAWPERSAEDYPEGARLLPVFDFDKTCGGAAEQCARTAERKSP